MTPEARKEYNRAYKLAYRQKAKNAKKEQEYHKSWYQANKEKINKYKRDKRAAARGL